MTGEPPAGTALDLAQVLAALPPPQHAAALRAVIEKARELHRAGALPEAEGAYRRVLQVDPRNADALHLLGMLAAQTGHVNDSLDLIDRAIAVDATVPSFHANRGNALRFLGRREDAVAAYRRAIDLSPDLPAAHVNMATVLKHLGRLDEAIAAARRATELLPGEAGVHFALGNIYRRAERFTEAAAAYRRAVKIDPAYVRGHEYLARMLHKVGDPSGAVDVLRDWLRHEPGHPVALHTLAAMTGGDAGPRASDGYVKLHFDDFSDTFDERLELLEYSAPRLAADAVARALGPPRAALDVLDAGCGTGWCGPLLRPYARRLSGVDLSAGMLTRARARGSYDSLEAGELTAFLAASREAFDLIVSTDVLIYFADLGPTLAAAAGALRPQGRFVFTVEHLAEERPEGFQLHPHGRYSHTEAHVRGRLADAGFGGIEIATAVLRLEAGEPVPGLVVTARR